METETKPKSKRGFASMSPERQREIASRGGKTAHAKGTAHKYNSETARAAGLKGGRSKAEKKNAEQKSQQNVGSAADWNKYALSA